jgi:hypothetical protein
MTKNSQLTLFTQYHQTYYIKKNAKDIKHAWGNDKYTIHLGLLGFWTLSIVWLLGDTKKHNVLETGSVSILRWGVGDTYSVGSISGSVDTKYIIFVEELTGINHL